MANTSTFALNQKINQLQAQVNGIITDLIPYPIGDVARLNVAQDWSAIQTFNVLPETAIAPTTDDQLANKKYVDDEIALVGLQQVLTTDNVSNLGIILQDTLVAPTETTTLTSGGLTIAVGSDTLAIDKTSITHTNATNGLTISSTGVQNQITIETAGYLNLGDVSSAGNDTTIVIDDVNKSITLSVIDGSIIADCGASGVVYLGDTIGGGIVTIAPSQVITSQPLGIQLTKNTIKYPTNVRSTNYNFTDFTDAIQTFTTAVTVTLFIIDDERNGKQFIITNASAGNLVVNSSSSQLIYTTGFAPATTRTLASGATRQFTSIRSTGGSVYGWSMI